VSAQWLTTVAAEGRPAPALSAEDKTRITPSGTRPLLECREGCGACCIAPSISTLGKPAGVSCIHLTENFRCAIFGQLQRPMCCSGLRPSPEMCCESREQALAWLGTLEQATAPGKRT